MKLIDKSYSHQEKEEALRTLDGCICRICVSDDPLEIVRMLGFANDYLAMLAQSRMLQLKEENTVPCIKCRYNAGVLINHMTNTRKVQCVRDGYNRVELVPDDHKCERGEVRV